MKHVIMMSCLGDGMACPLLSLSVMFPLLVVAGVRSAAGGRGHLGALRRDYLRMAPALGEARTDRGSRRPRPR